MSPHEPTEAASHPTESDQPLLRSLAPMLTRLASSLRAWLDRPHRFPLPTEARARLEKIGDDLRRRANELTTDRPLMTVMLMGGTGVGKSTLLNALAGAPVAQASFTRPTTRDPVVYHHESVRPDGFDSRLRHCRLIQHNREGLAQKVIVDTPDLDSNDQSNRAKLEAILPLADVVLYVGSQEKYHDRIGWEMFKQQRSRRAFAFVLNKWDRCTRAFDAGISPDEDLLRDLKAEGFEEPKLFRTVAQQWLEFFQQNQPGERPAELPEGEQFLQLREWLELGLTALEIEAVKARGVGQLLNQLQKELEAVRPPDLVESARDVSESWANLLREEADHTADVLVSTLEPYQGEVEHHFSVEGQARFRGLMAGYLRLMSRLKYAGSSLRDRVPLAGRSRASKLETPAHWDLARFTREAVRHAGDRILNQRRSALINKLLVEADRRQFPLGLLSQPTQQAGRLDWLQRYDRALVDALGDVERMRTHPTGWRRFVQVTLTTLANYVPELVLIGSVGVLIWRYTVSEAYRVEAFDVALPFLLTLTSLVVFHVLIAVLMPLRWRAIRSEFHDQLTDHLGEELHAGFGEIPVEVAEVLGQERHEIEEIVNQINETSGYLRERERAATVAGLYGH